MSGICDARRAEIPCVTCVMPKGHRGDHIAHGYAWTPNPMTDETPSRVRRWNVEEVATGTLRICRGLHVKALGCEWEYVADATVSAGEEPK